MGRETLGCKRKRREGKRGERKVRLGEETRKKKAEAKVVKKKKTSTERSSDEIKR